MSSNLRPFVWSTLLVRPGVFELVRISPNSFILISATGPLSASEAGIFNIWATHQPATLSWPKSPTHSHLLYFFVIWMTIQPPNSCSLSDPFLSISKFQSDCYRQLQFMSMYHVFSVKIFRNQNQTHPQIDIDLRRSSPQLDCTKVIYRVSQKNVLIEPNHDQN